MYVYIYRKIYIYIIYIYIFICLSYDSHSMFFKEVAPHDAKVLGLAMSGPGENPGAFTLQYDHCSKLAKQCL